MDALNTSLSYRFDDLFWDQPTDPIFDDLDLPIGPAFDSPYTNIIDFSTPCFTSDDPVKLFATTIPLEPAPLPINSLQKNPIFLQEQAQKLIDQHIKSKTLEKVIEISRKIVPISLRVDIRNQEMNFRSFIKLINLFPKIREISFNASSIRTISDDKPSNTKKFTPLECAITACIVTLTSLEVLEIDGTVLSRDVQNYILKKKQPDTKLYGFSTEPACTLISRKPQSLIPLIQLDFTSSEMTSKTFIGLISKNSTTQRLILDNIKGVSVKDLDNLKICKALVELSVIGMFKPTDRELKLSFIKNIVGSCLQLKKIRFSNTQQLTERTIAELRTCLTD